MEIDFIHPGKAFLPEISAYRKFFLLHQIDSEVIEVDSGKPRNGQIEWQFMGIDIAKPSPGKFLIHEYASSSIPPWRKFKNRLKKNLTIKPDYRIFLNEYVRAQFSFNDDVPFGFRDMGVNLPEFRTVHKLHKKYDFIYVGNVGAERQIDAMINSFTTGRMAARTLLILSRNYQSLKNKLGRFRNISFAGPVPPEDVRSYIIQSKFALNFIPDSEPYNAQTPSKFLEYAAASVPIVSTSFKWMRNFQADFGGSYFYVRDDLSNFDWDQINAFTYAFPDLRAWSWEHQIRNSGVLAFISSKFPQFSF
ncbi:MAG TPA: hypothetical protein VKR32_08550 [Puia sp.]|nr:hypothetical protein [Puia sp.]